MFNKVYGAKEKYRGVFEIQRSGDKTSSGEIGLDIRTHASPKVGQDQVSGGVSLRVRSRFSISDRFPRKWKIMKITFSSQFFKILNLSNP